MTQSTTQTDPEPQDPPPTRSHRVRLTALVAVGVVLALGLGYVAAYAWVGAGIPRGTTVAGVDIGGLTDDEAVETLSTELADPAAAVTVEVDGRTREVPAPRLGLSFDPTMTVASVPSRTPAPQALIQQVAGQEVDPVVDVDQRRLSRAVRALTRSVDDPVRQARIEYDGDAVVVVPPRTGNEVDRAAAEASIVDHYLVTDSPVALAPVQVAPYVSEEEAQAFADTEATEAISAPITVVVGSSPIDISAEHLASVLSYRGTADGMAPTVDAELLRELIAEPLAEVGRPARDATFDVSSGKPKVVPARTGTGVDDDSLADGVVSALESADGTAQLELERVEPDLTTAEAKDLGVTEQISTFTQWFPYAAYRVTNIGVASSKINGTLLEPGETFSMNGVVGERTPENGFVKGFVIEGGRLVEDYGGAVSTITTAMWHTAFYAGMTRLEQRAHGFWISRYVAGLEATVSWGFLDLKFRNDTPYGVYITSSLTDSSVTVSMWSTKYWDIKAEFGPRTNPTTAGTIYDTSDTCVPQEGVGGFDITVTRVWSRDGKVVKREELPTHYDAAPTVICEPKPTKDPKGDDADQGGKPGQDGGGSGGGAGGGGGGGAGGGGGG